MARTFALARRGEGRTRPNPPVGAVVVDAAGRPAAEAWHRGVGRPHAEAAALAAAGDRARGGTLFVSLEPCSTWGRTPPCTERILAAGVRRVVYGVRDPNPDHDGRGLRRLRRAGVAVERGGDAAEATALVGPFGRWVRTGRPWLTLKLGATLDGRIADRTGRSRWITGPEARRRVQALRRSADAILVGAETARRDDPRLGPRPALGRRPWRVVVDSRGRLPPSLRLLCDGRAGETIVAVTAACPAAVRRRLAAGGARVWVCRARGGQVSLPDLARRLGRLGLLHVLCEGGGRMAASLLRAGWVDAVAWFAAPRLIGGDGTPALAAPGWPLRGAPRLRFTRVERLGADLLIHATPAGQRACSA